MTKIVTSGRSMTQNGQVEGGVVAVIRGESSLMYCFYWKIFGPVLRWLQLARFMLPFGGHVLSE
jgi:hypothetical protein